ncbi:cellulase family glycosylhydrolase [Blautia massiliensis]|uniref:glycoside hydrolase family 5 protein n=1 Tax=Blautia TaxID=572511 RepID=UPI00156F98BD|nr:MULTISPECIES: cellulase family glycosylhydrolase [Blautia]MCC2724302.1 cellulase family glycosylhydrolase [Blautia sp. MSK22_86]NSF58370.1 cellulase family glycosylhydrolase [Blautia massiliensis (ex Durand et al. 2017)]NSK73714.1 cellulase family glycosylhydrolase [Blautia massiliensis (ex Durand et al. 2017)]
MNIKGVNLGNWLVLEKWMNPALFEGTTAEDEYYLPTQLSPEVYESRIKIHRSEYITERDFVTIKRMGMDSVRIPVPYFIFGDRKPFIGCIEELDKAFNWAEKYGLTILIDLHTVPLSQNGFDNGGISGVCKWAQNPDEVEFVLGVLERLAKRYGHRKGLFGIQPLNEPVTENMWETMDVQNRYAPADPELAKGSAPITMEFLRKFYLEAYDRISTYMPKEKYVVLHDGFELMAWKDFMQEEKYSNVILDTHQYLMVAEARGCSQTIEGYLKYVREELEPQITEMEKYFPVICGEWCLFNSLACGCDTKGGQSVLNGVEGSERESLSTEEKKEIYATLAKAQLELWDKCSGYFYWSYKLLTDTVNTPGWIGWDSWDLGRCVDFGWFPAGKGEK